MSERASADGALVHLESFPPKNSHLAAWIIGHQPQTDKGMPFQVNPRDRAPDIYHWSYAVISGKSGVIEMPINLELHGLLLAGLVGAAIGAVFVWVLWRFGRAASSARTPISKRIEDDLKSLQMDDTVQQLTEGYNRLLDQVSSANRALEVGQLSAGLKADENSVPQDWAVSLLDKMPHPLMTVTSDWTITYANNAAGELLGETAASLEGRNLAQFCGQTWPEIVRGEHQKDTLRAELPSSGRQIQVHLVNIEGVGESDDFVLFLEPTQVIIP